MVDSPWLRFERRKWDPLKIELNCDLVIVGAGISGVATLYYLLKNTDKNVVLLEKDRVASGATGNNAGLAVTHIERSVCELVEDLGLEATQKAFEEIDGAWDELLALHEIIGLKDNLVPFESAKFGFSCLESLIDSIREDQIQKSLGRGLWRHLVSETVREKIPEELLSSIEFISPQAVLQQLKVIDDQYIGLAVRRLPIKAARMNSARFCFALLEYMEKEFPDRFNVFEETEVSKIHLYGDHATLFHAKGLVTTEEIVLCTNGYKNFSIFDHVLKAPFTKLQDTILPREGFLSSFGDSRAPTGAHAFMNNPETSKDTPYWYLSRVPMKVGDLDQLSILGGPEFLFEKEVDEEWIQAKAEKSQELMREFLLKTFGLNSPPFSHFWHGRMGYTENGLRWVGQDEDHPCLWYNLACNGIGIVPAIAGAKKISMRMRKP